MSDYGPPHRPKPTDICEECGMGLVHITPSMDPAPAGLDVEPWYRELQRVCPDCRSPKQAATEHGYGCPPHREMYLAARAATRPAEDEQ